MQRSGPAATQVVPGIENLTEIGHGGAGVVYRGRQPDLDREVAVKVVWSSGTPEVDLARWRREVTAMARLSNHPNIVAVYDGGTTADGLPYLVMPYVPGGTLGDRVRAEGTLRAEEVVATGRSLAAALTAAHAAGVLHRDVKPDNVLLSPYGEPQLTDFGIARLLDATATTTNGVRATVAYAAPEVLTGQPASEASDVYSLGATLHACLTGAAPFVAGDGEQLLALAVRVASEAPPDLRAAGVPDVLADVVGQAMAKDPRERIATPAELGRRLDGIAGSAASPASAPGPGEQVRRDVDEAHPAPSDAVPVDGDEPIPTGVLPLTGPAREPPAVAVPSTMHRTARPGGPGPVPVTRPRRPAPVLAVVGIVLLGALVVALIVAGRGGRTDDESELGEPVPTTPVDDATVTEAPGTDLGSVALAYFEAIGNGDLEGAYAMTSPGFRTSQPFDGYADFWGSFNRVSVATAPQVDERALMATIDVELDGGVEAYTLSFVRSEDGTPLIDGPRPR